MARLAKNTSPSSAPGDSGAGRRGGRWSPSAPPRFYPDDPIWVDDDKALDASKTGVIEDSNLYDFVANTFADLGETRDVRAMNVNTVDEVPDSSWFTNRIGRRQMSVEEIVRGPDSLPGVSLDGWIVSGGKSTGVQPGFRMKDKAGWTYQIEFDPPSNPEMATGVEMIGTAFYHAIGYHVVEVYITELDPEKVVIDAEGEGLRPAHRRAARLDEARSGEGLPARSARQPNGRFRVLASRFAAGKPLGNFRYYGTRPDDPNDIVPHEHRRELRGARVFGAWLNHDDSRGVNSLDFLTTEGARNYVKHYMFDFGSIMGSGTVHAQRHRRRQRVHLRVAPGLADARYAWALHAALARTTTTRTCRRRSDASRATPSTPRSGNRNTPTRRSGTCGPTTRSGRRASSRGSPMSDSRGGRQSEVLRPARRPNTSRRR